MFDVAEMPPAISQIMSAAGFEGPPADLSHDDRNAIATELLVHAARAEDQSDGTWKTAEILATIMTGGSRTTAGGRTHPSAKSAKRFSVFYIVEFVKLGNEECLVRGIGVCGTAHYASAG